MRLHSWEGAGLPSTEQERVTSSKRMATREGEGRDTVGRTVEGEGERKLILNYTGPFE